MNTMKDEEPRFEKIDHASDYRLPASYTREIGRVVVRWSFFERHVQSMIWAIAFDGDQKIGAALGRLAIVEQKFPDRLGLLRQLAKLRGVGFDEALLKLLETKSRKLVCERNLLVHGNWTNHPVHGWMVRETRGAWSASKSGPSGTRKIMPQSKQRDQMQIRQTVAEIDNLIENMLAFKHSLDDRA